jgi:hypothetical protein
MDGGRGDLPDLWHYLKNTVVRIIKAVKNTGLLP